MKIRAYFARHAQVLIGSLGRITQQPTATLLTMAVIAVALALPLFLNLFLQNARDATANWNDAYNLSVYMDKKAGAGRASALAEQLQKRGDIAAVRIITADQALAEFRKDSGFGSALDALADNPLPDTLIVTPTLTMSTPRGTDALKAVIAAMPDVQTVQLDTEWVRRLYAMLDLLRTVLYLTCGLLGLGVVLIVSNTIRLDILNRRGEIEVMKLVGASDGFARRPFLYSGIWYGLGGGVLALMLVAIASWVLTRPVDQLANLYGSTFRLEGLGLALNAGVIGVSVGLAWVGSWLAATRHIRAIEPT
ncbi:MAG TPA: permease-like cell division protein FtsX [Steroidobacteraceae bacterium]|nr:permease-like cell division protein FtsX [Steroidobacteraceae bacterium]